MDKDAANLKKWLINMGLDINDSSDEIIKKLIPPQRRDMWRNIIKHVRPEEEANLIKKSLLLHKLQKRQKPLMAKVESDEDLANAIKYEELLIKYNKIKKDIVDIKTKNNEEQKYIKKINVTKDNLTVVNEFNKNKSFLAEQKTGYYSQFNQVIQELSEFCNYFAAKANDNLIKTDYEDSLIKCFAVVDNAKQRGTMNDSVNLGKDVCNIFYATLRDKSPVILIETIEENLKTHISESFKVLTSLCIKRTEQCNYSDREVLFKTFFKKLLEKQLELKTILSKSEAEKDHLTKKLVENSRLIKNDIISQFKLQNVSHTEEQLRSLKINISEAFEIVIKNCLDCSNVIGWPVKPDVEDETFKTLDSIFDKTTKFNDKIERKRQQACSVLNELHEKSSDFGLPEINTEMEKIAEDYSKKVPNMDEINKLVISMKRVASTDVENIHKTGPELVIKQDAHKFRTLEEIADHIESLDVFAVLRKQFEEFNKIICVENYFAKITKRESAHTAEFHTALSQMKSQLLELNISVEDCKLVADVVSNKKSEK